MISGRLDRYVNIQSVAYADDDYGDSQTPTWSNYATDVPMGIKPMKGSEPIEAAQRVALSPTTWVARYDSGITEEMRIVHDSENYYIISIQETGRNDGLEILTEKRDNE